MKIDLVIYLEDPTFGVRGSRKFWAASFDTAAWKPGVKGSIATRWGRIPEGTTININWLYGQQHKSVLVEDEAAAQKFIDKKSAEKKAKGYKVALYIVDGVNIGNLYGSAADSKGFIKMSTRTGTD